MEARPECVEGTPSPLVRILIAFQLEPERPAAVIGTCVDPRRRKSHKPLIGPRNAAMPLEHGRFFLLKTKI